MTKEDKQRLKENHPRTRASLSIQEGKKMKQILYNVTGYAKPKTLIAIMGASGSGKTSLLNVFADRLALTSGSKLEGHVSCNKRNVD